MGLSRGKKIALLLGTLWPPVYVVLFAVAIFVLLTQAITGATHDLMVALIPLQVFTVVEVFVLLAIYAYLVLNKLDTDDRGRLIWLLAVVLGGSIGQLIFYFKKVRPVEELAEKSTGEAESADSSEAFEAFAE